MVIRSMVSFIGTEDSLSRRVIRVIFISSVDNSDVDRDSGMSGSENGGGGGNGESDG